QEIAQANPPADASLLPDSVLDLHINLDNKSILTDDELTSIRTFRRAADYIAA
ncbi:hypothetical protein FIBSPDRAFT_705530, partial [Athelia psychrophila]